MSHHSSHRQTTDGWDTHVRTFALTLTNGNEEDAAQWPEADWRAAAIGAASLRPAPDSAGTFVMDPNEVVPEWLRQEVSGRLTAGGDSPEPTICTLWVDRRNWFALARDHPNELVVSVVTPAGWPLDVDQFQAVWDNATAVGALPFMTISLLPKVEKNGVRFVAEIESFFIVTPAGIPSVDEHASSILDLSPCTRSWETPVSDAELLDAARALRGDPALEARVTVWDWMSGSSDLLDPAGPIGRRPA